MVVADIPLLCTIVTSMPYCSEQFDTLDPLPELVRRILSTAEKVDSDVRSYTGAYNEKKSALTAMERKRGGNLMVTSLEDVITQSALDNAGAEFMPADSEYLVSLVLVIPKLQDEVFLASYETLAPEAVPYGPPNNRELQRGSPVVPHSAKKITEDKDGYSLYIITSVKKHVDALRTACREKRFVVRDFTFDPSASGRTQAAIAALEVEVAATLAHLREQSGRKYSEAIALWMHMKAIRLFVESVLRYGLPTEYGPGRVAFAGAVVQIHRGAHKKVQEAICEAWGSMSGGGAKGLLDMAYGETAKDKCM
jgi:V-type H+-transporting ATPase subunit C